MRTHIDWLTFTIPMLYGDYDEEMSTAMIYAVAIEDSLENALGSELHVRGFTGEWQRNERGRAPYPDSWTLRDAGITLFASPTLAHCCVEISGTGCERLIALEALTEVLKAVSDRVTRIDIATDIETATRPSEFVFYKSHERMRANGYQNSSTGETCYVGSQKSDRYARVYRYNPPHPRANLLRVECVFRRGYAKVVAQKCVETSVYSIALAAGKAFGWSSVDWQPELAQSTDISIVGENRKTSNTVHWLINSCAPAFQRLVKTGEIRNAQKFFERYFLPEE